MKDRPLKILSASLVMAVVLVMSGCSLYSEPVKEVTQTAANMLKIGTDVGLDMTDGDYTEIVENHGGFHGDGETYSTVKFPDDSLQEDIKDADGWKELPMSTNVTALIYGITEETENGTVSYGPFLRDVEENALLPEIENGYYFFMDRQAEDGEDKYDDSKVLDRSSYNFTVAVYDTDTDTLHYVKFDT